MATRRANLISDPERGQALWICSPRNGVAEWLMNEQDLVEHEKRGTIIVNGLTATIRRMPPEQNPIRPNVALIEFDDSEAASREFDPKPSDAGRWER